MICLKSFSDTTSISDFTIGGQQGNVTYNENDTNIEVKCSVDSNPPSDIYLYSRTYNGEGRIAKKVSTRTLLYVIPTATCFDAGIYLCTGNNSYTRKPVSLEAWLFVRCK